MPHHCDACWWALARTSLPRVPAVLVDSPIAPAYLATFDVHARLPCTWCGYHLLDGDRCWRCNEPDTREERAKARADIYLYDYGREVTRVLNPWAGLLIPEQRSMIGAPVLGAWCERCASYADNAYHGDPPAEPPTWQDSRTMYHWSGIGLHPNAPSLLCAACAEEHHAHWDDMWSNVSHY
jgi:hypothetical protein